MLSVIVNPFPWIILHLLIVIASAALFARWLRTIFVPTILAMAVALAASLLWRHCNFSASASWRDLLYEPVFQYNIVRHPGGEEIFAVRPILGGSFHSCMDYQPPSL